VQPSAEDALKKILRPMFQDKLYVGREDFDYPITCKCKYPEKVGDDRLLNGLGAYEMCKRACIVIDLGTALTIDYVCAKGEFEGGLIFPGVWASARALARETAQLPEIESIKPGPVVGRDTEEAIQSGLFWGYRALINGMVREFKVAIHGRPKIYATGGDAPYVMKDLDFNFEMVPHLTLIGMRLSLKIQKGI
jgi:type III pantothenate kinase